MSLLSRADHKDCNSFLHIRDINQFHESNQIYMIFLGGVGGGGWSHTRWQPTLPVVTVLCAKM